MSAVRIQHIFFLPLLSVLTLVFVDMDNHKLLPYIYVFAILIYSIYERKLTVQWNHTATILLITAIIFITIRQIHYFSSSSIRIVISSLILLLFFPKNIINKTSLSILILISSFFSFAYVINQYFMLDLGRGWSVNAIIHSTFTVSLLSVAFYLCHTSQNKLLKVNILSCILLALCVNLSATRGSLLCFIISGLLICLYLLKRKNIKALKLLSSYALILFIIVFNTSFIERISQTVSLSSEGSSSLSKIQRNEPQEIGNLKIEYNSSYRIEAWIASVDIIKNSFPFGEGKNVKQSLGNKITSPSSILSTLPFHHFHNQYINSLAIDGILGISYVLLLLLYPIYCFIKKRNEASTIFAIVAVVYSIASLTDVALDSKPTLCFYLTMFIIYQHYSPVEEPTKYKQKHLQHASHI